MSLVVTPGSYLELVLGLLAGLFESFHKGNFSEWAMKNLTEDFLLTHGGKMDDRSEERSCIGRDFLALYYNNILHRVWKGPTSKITWEPLEAVETSPGIVKLIVSEKVVGEEGWVDVRRRIYVVNINKKLHQPISLLVLPPCEEDEMTEDTLLARDCVPTHQDVKEWLDGHKDGSGDEASYRQLAPPTTERPCEHNNWDSVRVKRKWCLLRCRSCFSQWRIRATEVQRCPGFSQGTCVGDDCPKLHIHLRKQRFPQTTNTLSAKPVPPVPSTAMQGEG